MKRLISILCLSFTLAISGCGTTTVQPTATQIVKVEVPTKCTPITNITEIIEYPTEKLTLEMSLFEKVQLFIAENSLLRGQNKEVKSALGECTK